MRLDHLLSKEQLAQGRLVRVGVCGAVASPPADVRWGVLKGGTSIVGHRRWSSHTSTGGASAPQWNVVVVGVGVRDTLLGPEGSGDTHVLVTVALEGCRLLVVCAGWFLLVVGPADGMTLVVPGVGCRLYVENFTVDASIFVVFKFLRAHGGCLGTRNRRRT